MAIKVNPSMIGKLSAYMKPAPGKFAALCTGASPYQSEKYPGSIGVKLVWKYLQDEDDSNSIVGQPVQQWVTFPITEEDSEYEPTQWDVDKTSRLLSALYDDVPARPTYDKDTGLLMYKGEAIENSERGTCKYEADMIAAEKAAELWGEYGEGLEDIPGRVAYMETEYRQGSDFVNIKAMHSVKPESWELSDVYTIQEEVNIPVEPEVKQPTRTRRKRKKA